MTKAHVTRLHDITGQRFGRLIALHMTEEKKHGQARKWLCVCDCGNFCTVRSDKLKKGTTKSCKCFGKELKSKRELISCKHPLYNIYSAMYARCYNKKHKSYARYGGAGIKICERWLNSFEAFASDMGDRPSSKHSIDRIDFLGDYSPANCRWATAADQAINRKNNVRFEFNGEVKTISEWAKIVGISRTTMGARLKKHPVAVALRMVR